MKPTYLNAASFMCGGDTAPKGLCRRVLHGLLEVATVRFKVPATCHWSIACSSSCSETCPSGLKAGKVEWFSEEWGEAQGQR